MEEFEVVESGEMQRMVLRSSEVADVKDSIAPKKIQIVVIFALE